MTGWPAALAINRSTVKGKVKASMARNLYGQPTEGLNFGPLVRVSTEQQEQQGESLRTQRLQNERDVQRLGGRIVGWYGGAEHATPGWEQAELDRLIADAGKGKLDAVIVTHADRWSRDNAKSKVRLDTLRQHGIRFFVSTMEMDLFDPQHRFILGMNAEVGEFIALQQCKKSIENRIERARRGVPVCGKLPFGRTFDKKAEQWGIIPEKKALVEEAARRYLAGESMIELARGYGMAHAYLHLVLTQRCGTVWEQTFDSDRLAIHEVVKTTVPALLPEDTIRAVRRRVEANRTYTHKQAKHPYLLGRVVFCSHCGYAMSGQYNERNRNRDVYYRHAHKHRKHNCTHPKAWVRADDLEDAVLRDLFDLFGNPLAVQRAVEAATPNRERVEQCRQRQLWIAGELEKIGQARERIVRFIAKGTIREEEATKELDNLRDRETLLKKEQEQLGGEMANVPTAEQVQAAAGQLSAAFKRLNLAQLFVKRSKANGDFEGMSWDERRALVQLVFSGRTADGKRMGVYVEWADSEGREHHKTWRYRIVGRLVDLRGTAPRPPYEPYQFPDGEWAEEFRGGPFQKWLLDETKSSSLPQSGFSTFRLPFALNGSTQPGNNGSRTPRPFAKVFPQVFSRLDKEQGGHNLVSLVLLRQAIPLDRAAFDAGLQALRQAERYTLSAAEGRNGISPEEREAGIKEGECLLLFVSRREDQ